MDLTIGQAIFISALLENNRKLNPGKDHKWIEGLAKVMRVNAELANASDVYTEVTLYINRK